MTEERPTVLVSGGFDPVHAGHIRMIRDAAQHGAVASSMPVAQRLGLAAGQRHQVDV